MTHIAATSLSTPLQVSVTNATRGTIRHIAEREGISQAQVIRDLIDAGLQERLEQSKALTPERE